MLRFAPSPTGDMHIGNLRVAIFNYIVSKQLKEPLLIRIEDTDDERNIKDKDKSIIEILNLFGIEYFNLIHQSDNLKIHQRIAMDMLNKKQLFNCFCSEEKLNNDREKSIKNKIAYRYSGTCKELPASEVIDNPNSFTVRVKKPSKNIEFEDSIKGKFAISPNEVDDFIVLRKNKKPTYNFACAIDDMVYDISTVIRGEDHLSNTPKQIYIRNLLNYDKEIKYVHLPIILNIDGKKMSKRDDSSTVQNLIDDGFLPSAIANYLVLIGNKTPKEIFTIEEAIEWFKIENISKSPAKFDIDKLKFINKEHIKLLDNLRLSKIIGFSDEDIGKLAKLYLEESDTINEIKNKISTLFSKKDNLEDFSDEVIKLRNSIKEAPFFEDFNDFKKYISKDSGLKGKNLFKPLRYLLTGKLSGPNLSDIYPLIKNYLGEII